MRLFFTKPDEGIQLLYTNTSFPLTYQINSVTYTIMNGEELNRVESTMEWTIEKWITNKDGFQVDISAGKRNVTQCPPVMEQMMEFLGNFNFPLSGLSLQLNDTGMPVKIYNQQEVWDRWQYLKQNQLAGYDKDESTKGIIQGGNSDFNNTIPVLHNSCLYLLFFTPVYGNKPMSTSNFQLFTQDSQLFQGHQIKVSLDERVTAISNITTDLKHTGEGY